MDMESQSMSTIDQTRPQPTIPDAQPRAMAAALAAGPSTTRTFRIWRGTQEGGDLVDYKTEVSEGMVVLDAVHQIQAEQASDMAVRWNCKAGKCGSCSAEINGKPRLMCMTRLSDVPEEPPVTITPMRAFPVVRDLVTDVSYNYEINRRLPGFKPRKPDFEDGSWRMYQYEVDRPQEMRKCIECFLCQDVCHVLRSHGKHERFIGPAFLVRAAAYEMHPLDTDNRATYLKNEGGIGYCNITKCCTEVCPENITITDNAIIPLKERVVDRHYDPIARLVQLVRGK
jgi:succinate dehydrogenase / fumarate reductase, iron-sulfur subunit